MKWTNKNITNLSLDSFQSNNTNKYNIEKFMLHTPTKSEESILEDHLLHITVSNGLAFRWIESEENNMHPTCQYDFVTTCPIPNTNWTFGSKYWTNWTYEKEKKD
nr:7690_t:CDS:2 [Entrophospora candida]